VVVGLTYFFFFQALTHSLSDFFVFAHSLRRCVGQSLLTQPTNEQTNELRRLFVGWLGWLHRWFVALLVGSLVGCWLDVGF